MIKLYQFPAGAGLPNASPFCLKLETWLRMAGLDYEVVDTPNPNKTPLGKLPVIDHDGNKVADSSCAIAYLEKACGINLNAQLNPTERANAHALQRMLEEHTYWTLLHYRWLDEDIWPQTREQFFAGMPGLLQAIVPGIVRKKLRRAAIGHGLERHSADEIQRRFREDMQALAAHLGEKPYFGGYQPANVDAVAFAWLAQILLSTLPTPLTDITREFGDLVSYTERMRDRYFPEIS